MTGAPRRPSTKERIEIDRNRAHTTETVVFPDVPLSPGGTLKAGQGNNRVQGGFYGPDHAEAAGIFEQSGIVDALSAGLVQDATPPEVSGR